MSFWKELKFGSIYVKGGTHIHAVFVIGTAPRIIISILFIGSLFGQSKQGIIYASDSTVVLATIVFDCFLIMQFTFHLVETKLGFMLGTNDSFYFNFGAKYAHG